MDEQVLPAGLRRQGESLVLGEVVAQHLYRTGPSDAFLDGTARASRGASSGSGTRPSETAVAHSVSSTGARRSRTSGRRGHRPLPP